MSVFLLRASASLLLLLCAACSSGSDPTSTSTGSGGAGSGGDAAGGGGASAGGGGNTGACNELTPPVDVDYVIVPDAYPTPSGGPITDGTYTVASATAYESGPASQTFPGDVLVFSANGTHVENAIANSSNSRLSADVTTSEPNVTFTFTCGGSGSSTFPYDASPTEFAIYQTAAKVVVRYARQ